MKRVKYAIAARDGSNWLLSDGDPQADLATSVALISSGKARIADDEPEREGSGSRGASAQASSVRSPEALSLSAARFPGGIVTQLLSD
jgi:hypothetical protein